MTACVTSRRRVMKIPVGLADTVESPIVVVVSILMVMCSLLGEACPLSAHASEYYNERADNTLGGRTRSEQTFQKRVI